MGQRKGPKDQEISDELVEVLIELMAESDRLRSENERLQREIERLTQETERLRSERIEMEAILQRQFERLIEQLKANFKKQLQEKTNYEEDPGLD